MNQQNKKPMSDEEYPDMPEHNEQEYAQDPLAPEEVPEEDQQSAAGDQAHGSDARVEALQAELDKTKDQMLRAVAEAENTRKRLMREREDVRKFAISDFAKDLLDFSDNFRRALGSIPDDLKDVDDRVANVIAGVEAMEKELLKSFEKNGIKKIEPMGEIFDPNYHEVMFESPGTGKPAGTIIELIEPGYLLHDRLLRPARVGVAKDEGQGNSGGSDEPGGTVDTQA